MSTPPSASSSAAAAASSYSATPAPSAPASSASASAAAASNPALTLLRENSFYKRPPQDFLNDIANAAQDYLGDGCDSLEKAINQQIVKKPNRKQDIGQAVDAYFASCDARLQAALPSFESQVLTGPLRIPSDIILASELKQAAQGFGGGNVPAPTPQRNKQPQQQGERSGATDVSETSTAEDESALLSDLASLQQRLLRATMLNRSLREEHALFLGDRNVFQSHAAVFQRSDAELQNQARTLAVLEDVAAQAQNLKQIQSALVGQFVEMHGTEEEGGAMLTGMHGGAASSSSSGDASGAAAAAASKAGSSSLTQQINFAALRAAQGEEVPAAAAAASALASAPSSSIVQVSPDADSDLF